MEQTENNLTTTTKTNFQTATEAGRKGLEATGRFMTKLLDLADKVDRKLYGNRMRWFVIFSLLVVLCSPLIDHFRGKYNDTVTVWTTFLFLLFLIILFLSWIGAWREDDGSWNWKMVRFRLQIHFELFMDFFNDFKLKTRDEKYTELQSCL